MTVGTIHLFDFKKKYGFVKPDDGGNDVFIHAKELLKVSIKDLNRGSLIGLKIGYELGVGISNKKQAVDIKIINNTGFKKIYN